MEFSYPFDPPRIVNEWYDFAISHGADVNQTWGTHTFGHWVVRQIRTQQDLDFFVAKVLPLIDCSHWRERGLSVILLYADGGFRPFIDNPFRVQAMLLLIDKDPRVIDSVGYVLVQVEIHHLVSRALEKGWSAAHIRRPLMHWMSYFSRFALEKIDAEETFKWLVEIGADINARNDKGETALWSVTRPEHVQVLLDLGIDRSPVTTLGEHISKRAEAIREEHPDTYQLLMSL
jgi:hypothetical protein